MATVRAVIDAGMALSKFNRLDMVDFEAAALTQVVDRAHRVMFQFAARVNPLYFSAQADVPFSSGGWARPANAESVWRIEGRGELTTPTIADEVRLVPIDDRVAFAGTPSVYRIGTMVYGSGNTGDPTAGLLRFFFARSPSVLTYGGSLDAAWPDAYTSILEFEVAAFQARADGGRDGELGVMVAERDRLIDLFEQHLEHDFANTSRRFGEVRRIATERREPLRALVQA